jgi:hypothetical protein
LVQLTRFTNNYRGSLRGILKSLPTVGTKQFTIKAQLPELMATPVEETTDTTQTKKKRGPNWLPRQEEQLAISWINVRKQPEFATNQSGKTFYWNIQKDFNTHSKAHYRDHGQIKTW